MSTLTQEALAALADGLSTASAALAQAVERIETLMDADPVPGVDYLPEDMAATPDRVDVEATPLNPADGGAAGNGRRVMSQTAQPGEWITVTYERVQVLGQDMFGNLQIELPNVDDAVEVRLVDDDGKPLTATTVERCAPAQWPPRHGDLWRDTNGALWVATGGVDDGEAWAALIPLNSAMGRRTWGPDDVLQDYGPMALEYRPAGSDGAS